MNKSRAIVVIAVILVAAGNGISQELKIADCPLAITSFGAAICDGYLYVYGGNAGTAHSFSSEGQNHVFRRIQLKAGADWESLGEVPRRQGNALVTYGGKIYRLGGFEARNKAGAEQDMHSSNEFMVYDPKSRKWSALENLPEARSSFDAVVMGNTLFVVGGWSLNGQDKETQWHKTAWKFNLQDTKGKWQSIKQPPFVRRANSLGFHKDKVYVLGGMEQRGGPTTKVACYNPAKDAWSEGPKLPGDVMQGFGSSAYNVGGALIVSTLNGQILKLADDGSEWEKIGQLETGRFFHRLVGIDDHRFVILGGTNRESGKQSGVMVLNLKQLKISRPNGAANESAK